MFALSTNRTVGTGRSVNEINLLLAGNTASGKNFAGLFEQASANKARSDTPVVRESGKKEPRIGSPIAPKVIPNIPQVNASPSNEVVTIVGKPSAPAPVHSQSIDSGPAKNEFRAISSVAAAATDDSATIIAAVSDTTVAGNAAFPATTAVLASAVVPTRALASAVKENDVPTARPVNVRVEMLPAAVHGTTTAFGHGSRQVSMPQPSDLKGLTSAGLESPLSGKMRTTEDVKSQTENGAWSLDTTGTPASELGLNPAPRETALRAAPTTAVPRIESSVAGGVRLGVPAKPETTLVTQVPEIPEDTPGKPVAQCPVITLAIPTAEASGEIQATSVGQDRVETPVTQIRSDAEITPVTLAAPIPEAQPSQPLAEVPFMTPTRPSAEAPAKTLSATPVAQVQVAMPSRLDTPASSVAQTTTTASVRAQTSGMPTGQPLVAPPAKSIAPTPAENQTVLLAQVRAEAPTTPAAQGYVITLTMPAAEASTELLATISEITSLAPVTKRSEAPSGPPVSSETEKSTLPPTSPIEGTSATHSDDADRTGKQSKTESVPPVLPGEISVPQAYNGDAAHPLVNAVSQAHQAPASGVTATPAAIVADPVASPDSDQNKPSAAFHSLHLTQQMAGPELRFTWHSPDSGDIQLSTSLRQRDVQMTVNTDRGDTASAMRADLPYLDSRLQEHSLRLGEVSIVAHERSPSTGLGMAGEQRGHPDWSPHVVESAEQETPETYNESNENPIPILSSDSRVSVLA